MKITVNAMSDTCPIPVIKTKKAMKTMENGGTVEVLVDNEIAVQNLMKMARQKACESSARKLAQQQYQVTIVVPEQTKTTENINPETEEKSGGASVDFLTGGQETATQEENKRVTDGADSCIPDGRKKKKIVVLRSSRMGEGNDELGTILMKGFIYALTELEELPETILLYNGGAQLSCQGSDSLEDLKTLEAQGVEILTCGTCLNYYGLSDQLAVGTVTNMYVIAETMTTADTIICP